MTSPTQRSMEVETLHVPFKRFLKERGIEYINARSDRASTIEAGAVDFCLLHPRLPSLLIEFKDKGQLSAAQKKVHARLVDRGFQVHVVRDIGVATELVVAWLNGACQQRVESLNGARILKLAGAECVVVPGKEGGWHYVRPATLHDMGLPRV